MPDIIQASRSIIPILTGTISNLKKLKNSYLTGTTITKRKIIGSIYPKNLVFDGLKHRTARINEISENILAINKRLGLKKNWTVSELTDLSSVVVATLQVSNHFLSDLRLMANLEL